MIDQFTKQQFMKQVDSLNADERMKLVIEALENMKEGLEILLSLPEHKTIVIGVKNDLDKPINRLRALTGQFKNPVSTQTLPTVTTFFGKTVEMRQHVTSRDVELTSNDKEIFLKKRDDMFARFHEMSNDEIFKSTKEPQGIALLRSVAKIAGVEDYREAEIDITFLDEIRTAMGKANDKARSLTDADNGATELAERKANAVEEDEEEDEANPPAAEKENKGTRKTNRKKQTDE